MILLLKKSPFCPDRLYLLASDNANLKAESSTVTKKSPQ